MEPIDMEYILNSVNELSPNEPIFFDDSEFLDPSAVVRKIEGKGRGLFATTDILIPGQLIIVSKALAIEFGGGPAKNTNMNANHSNHKAFKLINSHLEKFQGLREALAVLIEDYPQLAQNVFNLHAGPKLGYLKQCALSELSETEINERIENICEYNSFEGKSVKSAASFGLGGASCNSCYGIWYFPSFLNHSCVGANCAWTIYGNLMIVRAIKPIRTGEELLISYIDPNELYKERLKLFSKHDFVCDCKLCKAEEVGGDDKQRLRELILVKFNDEIINSGTSFNDVEKIRNFIKLLKTLDKNPISGGNASSSPSASSGNDILEIFLIKPLIQLSLAHYEQRNYKDAAESFGKLFHLCGYLSQFNLLRISTILTIITCIVRENHGHVDICKEKTGSWKQYLGQTLLIQYGANMMNSKRTIVAVLRLSRASFVEEMSELKLLNWICDFKS